MLKDCATRMQYIAICLYYVCVCAPYIANADCMHFSKDGAGTYFPCTVSVCARGNTNNSWCSGQVDRRSPSPTNVHTNILIRTTYMFACFCGLLWGHAHTNLNYRSYITVRCRTSNWLSMHCLTCTHTYRPPQLMYKYTHWQEQTNQQKKNTTRQT